MMLTVKSKASKFLACLLAVVVAFGVIPVGMIFVAAAPVDGYTITLTDGTNVIDTLGDVEVTLTNDADSQKTETATTVAGVATFDGFVEEGESYTATIEAITGYDSTWSVQFTCDQQDDPDAVKNADIVLTALDKIVISGLVTDETDAPYSNAKVKISGYVTGETTTDEFGKYSFDAYKGQNYTITATATDNEDKYETATTTVTSPAANYECTTLKFAVKQFTITTTANDNGTITATEAVDYGSDKEITATANDGYRINSFVVDGTEIPEAKDKVTYSHPFNSIEKDHEVVVEFYKASYTVSFDVKANGKVVYDTDKEVLGGTIQDVKVDENGSVDFEAIANTAEGYHVEKVTVGDEVKLENGNNDTTTFEGTVTSDTINTTIKVTVEFAINEYNVSVGTLQNGSVSMTTFDDSDDTSLTVKHNDDVYLVICPNEGYELSEVRIGTQIVSDEDIEETIKGYETVVEGITTDTTIYATFVEKMVAQDDSYNIQLPEFHNTVNGVTYVPDGSTVTFTPAEGYKRVKVNNGSGDDSVSVTVGKNKKVKRIESIEVSTNSMFGGWSEPINLNITYDGDIPTISNVENAGKWFNEATIYSFTVSDALSGVKEVKYASTNDFVNATTIIPYNGKYNFEVTDEFNGDYYIWVIDYCGNTLATTVQVQIDKTIPTVDNFEFSTKENNIVQDAIEFLTFGLICAEPVYVTVTASDEDISSGLNEITLYVDGEVFAKKSGNSAIFELTEKDFKDGAKISATVVDVAGNVSDEKVYENIVKIDGTTTPTIEINPETEVYKDADGKYWYAGDLAIDITAGEGNTGIRSVKIELNGQEIITDEKGVAVNTDFSTSFVNALSFVINTNQNTKDGENIVKVTVVNNAGIKAEKEQKVYIDKTNPGIAGFNFTRKNSEPVSKVLNILTFGVFFNDKVVITVTADDANATSGVKEITLYAGDNEFDTVTVDENNKATFEIPVEEITDNTMHFNKQISATATDNVGHTTKVKVLPSEENSNVIDSNLMIETIKPEVSELIDTPLTDVRKQDGVHKYSGDAKITFSAQDKDSGLYSVAVKINGSDYPKELTPVTFTQQDTDCHEYILSTEEIEPDEDGKYAFVVTVTDNAGNVTEKELTIEKDLTSPIITDFEFSLTSDNSTQSVENCVTVEDYGYYFKEGVTVKVSAKDDKAVDAHEMVSGVKMITVVLLDKDNKYYTIDAERNIIAISNVMEAVAHETTTDTFSFNIVDDFKGQVFAFATDNVGNTPINSTFDYDSSKDVKVDGVLKGYKFPNGSVLESFDKHIKEDHIFFEKPETAYTTNTTENNELYATDVPVTITVVDTYSGIRSIEWSVEAEYDKVNKQGGTVTVNNDKTYADGSDAGWTNVETESNLVTKMQKEILVSNNSNDITVYVKMTDRAGNTSKDKIKFNIDKTTPVIDIVYDNNKADEENKSFYKADREAIITITERNFRAEDVVFAITNTDKVIPEIDLNDADVWTEVKNDEDPDKTTYTAKIKYTADGDYTFDIAYKDNAENVANEVEQHAFTIDKTLPVITVAYDNNDAQNGNYYKADRIATLTIVEHNFDPARVKNIGFATDSATGTPVATTFPTISAWQNVGTDTYVATIAYTADSKYTFDIEFKDMAGNSIVDFTPEEFYVDKTAPTLEISGVADKSANKGTVAPIVTYSDTNFNIDGVTITLTGINNGKVNYSAAYAPITNGQTYTYANFEEIQKVDDIYTLTAKLVDMAGNETEQTITFSANRFGSVYDLTDVKDILGKYLTTEQDIVFTETNVDSLDREDILIKLTKNGTPTDLIEGVDYTVETSGGNGRWSVYKYTIKKALFAGDGRYSISVYSTDAAGNVNENIDETKAAEISFGIDKTTPVIVPIDFESNEQYDVEMKTVSIEIKDNLVLEDVKIYLNGQEIEYTVDGETYTFNIPESNDKQDVKIVVVDAAGNEQVIEVNGFTVSTNFFVRWFNDTPVFIGSMVGMVALALGITIFLVFFKKKKKNEDEE